MRRLLLLAVLAAATGLASGSSASDPPCPASTIHLTLCQFSTDASRLDTTCTVGGGSPIDRAWFDLSTRSLGISVRPQFGTDNGFIRAAERYRLIGASPGTPVTFGLRMTVAASLVGTWTDVANYATATATLEVDGATLASATQRVDCNYNGCVTTGDLSAPLTAQVTFPTGQDFVLTAALSATAAGNIINPATAGANAVFQFEGLPPGISVVSCHDAATPTLPGTWGELKIRYR